jgi:hypothetical protein
MYHPRNSGGNRRWNEVPAAILALPVSFIRECCLFFRMCGVYGIELAAGDWCFFLVG